MPTLPNWLRSGRVQVGLLIVGLVVLCAVLAPVLAPNDPNRQDLLYVLMPPAWAPGGDAAYPLGTDSLCRACCAARRPGC